MSTAHSFTGQPGAPRLSVVIPTYERPGRVAALLDLLAAQTLAPSTFEVIVVDDGSREDPRPQIERVERPFHLVAVRQENAGAAAARRRGAQLARGEILLFLDDDMIPAPALLEEHLKVHDTTPRAVVMGCMRSSKKLAELSLFERFHAKKLEQFWAELRQTGRPPLGSELASGNLSLRRDDYLAVGGFDPSLPRAEDMELGIRLEKAGAVIRYCDAACAIHDSDRTNVEGWLRGAFTYGKSEHHISRKHPDLHQASPYRYLDVLGWLPRPAYALSMIAPSAGQVVARGVMRLAAGLDAAGLERAAIAGTTLAYGMEYFRGARVEAGSLAACARDIRREQKRPGARRGPRKGHTRRSERRAVFARFLASVRADHEMLVRSDARYDTRGRVAGSLARDLVERIGFQMMVACRFMRLLDAAGSPLAARVAARMIRLVYGADIHWDAHIADGVGVVHGMGLAIARSARIGKGVILSHNVTIGDGIDPETRKVGQPIIEDDVHIAPGAILLGPITVGARSKIGPNAVVIQSIPPDSVVETPPPNIRHRARRRGVATPPAASPLPATGAD
jgi:serine acetyltransferase/GT2 family glycosyltransferase